MIKISDIEAELKKVSTRKEGKGEGEKDLFLDMRFVCSTKAKGVTPDIFGDRAQVFWRDNADKDPLFFGIKSIVSDSKVDSATLVFCGIEFEKTVTLKGWRVTPRAHGMIDLSFVASVHEPTREQRHGVTEAMRTPGRLEVEGELDLLELMEADSDDEQSEMDIH